MPIRKDNRPEFLRKLRLAEAKAVKAMALRVVQLTQLAVNESAQPTTVKVKRRTKGGNKFTRTIYMNPSKKGEPPHKRTGEGQRNITAVHNAATARSRVGYRPAAKHMLIHELTGRAHLVPTVKKHRHKIGRLGLKVLRRSMPQS